MVKNLLYCPFSIDFLNPECVRIPWVLALKYFPAENFRVRSDFKKFRFSLISLSVPKGIELMYLPQWAPRGGGGGKVFR